MWLFFLMLNTKNLTWIIREKKKPMIILLWYTHNEIFRLCISWWRKFSKPVTEVLPKNQTLCISLVSKTTWNTSWLYPWPCMGLAKLIVVNVESVHYNSLHLLSFLWISPPETSIMTSTHCWHPVSARGRSPDEQHQTVSPCRHSQPLNLAQFFDCYTWCTVYTFP